MDTQQLASYLLLFILDLLEISDGIVQPLSAQPESTTE